MKKRKLLVCVLSLVLLVGVIVSALTMSASAARGTGGTIDTSTDWKETGLNLVQGKDYAYSFAVIGDTQNLNLYYDVDKGTEYMNTLYQWILDNQSAKNIQYVMGVGDITQSWNRDYGARLTNEWLNAAEALSLLDGKIGYSLVRGNHDFSDAKDGFNGVFGIGDKTANGVDNQYYENLLALCATKDAEGRPMAGFRIDGKIEETYRKVTMGGQKYIIFTLDWHPMSKETDCVKDTKDLCVTEEYCVTHYNTSKECSANSGECVKISGCKLHNSYVNGTTFCNTEICADDCTKHDTFGWMDSLLRENSDYSAIITMHSFIMRDGSTVDDVEDVFPYENINNSSRPLWHEVAVTGGNASPKQLWDSVLSKHANVKMIFCGHVDEDNIVTTQLRGDNGNTVTCQLIDGQTIDKNQEPVGLVAMYYMSADGSVANVEYISTVRAAAGKPAYLRDVNQFTLNLEYDSWTETKYGPIPTEIYNEYTFHVMLDDDSNPNTANTLYGSYNTWDEALTRVHELNGVASTASRQEKTYNIVMSKDYEFTNKGLSHNQACNCLSKTVFDLNGKTFTLGSGTAFLPYYNATRSKHPSFSVINGNFVMKGSSNLFITQHGHPQNAKDGEIDLNLENLNIAYASGATGSVVTYYGGSDNGPSFVNLNVINCNIDASAAEKATIFNFKQPKSNSDVYFAMTGGSIEGNANTTVFEQNYPGDTITFLPDANGNYTTFIFADNTQLNGVYYSESSSKNLEFSAPVAKDGKYVSTLVSSTGVLTKYGPIPSAYSDANTYPFALFKNGVMLHAFKDWGGFLNGEMFKTANFQTGCTLLLRRDWSTSESSTNGWALSYIKDLVIDLGENVLTRGNNHLFQAMGHGTASKTTSIKVVNGTLKTNFYKDNTTTAYTTPLICFNNDKGSTSNDSFIFTFEGIDIDVSSGRGIVATYTNGTYGTNNKIYINDCTINRGTSTSKMTLFSMNESSGNKNDTEVIINGGKLVANSIANLTFADFSVARDGMTESPDKFILGNGIDGNPFRLVLPSTYTVPTAAYEFTDGTHYVAKLQDNTDGTVSYTLGYAETVFGEVSQKYASVENYPFAVFYNGAFKAGYDTFKGAVNAAVKYIDTASEAATCDKVYVVMRRDCVDTAGAAAINTARGEIIVDLQGYQLSSSSSYILNTYINYAKLLADGEALPDTSYAYASNYLAFASTITFQNGTIRNNRSDFGLIGVDTKNAHSVAGYGKKQFVFNFDNVTLSSTGMAIVQAFGSKSGTGHSIEINVTNSTLDYSSAAEGTNMFICGMSDNIFTFDVEFVGCTVIASKLDSYKLYTLSSDDKATFGADENGVYLTVTQTTEALPTTALTANDGKTLVYYPSTSEGGKYNYVLMASGGVDTDYGEIPSDKADVNKYPLVLFEGTTDGYTVVDYYSDIATAFTKIAGALGKDYVILLRTDYTKTAGKYIGDFTGSLTIDLGGHTLSIAESGNYLFDLGVGSANGPKGTFNVKNGAIVKVGGRGIVCMNYNSNLKTKDAEYTFNFTDVTFSSTDNKYNKNVIFTTWESGDNGGFENATAKVVMNSTFENCTFDYRNSISGAVMLDLGHSSKTRDRVQHNVVIKGGTILANTAADINNNFAILDGNTNGRADTLKFDASSDGKYVTLVLPASVDASTVTSVWTTADGVKCAFAKLSAKDGDSVYELAIDSTYGKIPVAYANATKYPIAVFKADKTFVGAYNTFANAAKAAGLISGSGSVVGGADAVIYFRADFTHSAGSGHVAEFYNNVTIDLGGNTVTVTVSFLGMYFDGSLAGGATFGTITIKNGTFISNHSSGSYSILRLDSVAGATPVVYNVNFDNVTIGTSNTPYVAISTAKNSTGTVNSEFTNCVFDYTNAPAKSYMFASGNAGVINATIIGCEIRGGTNNAIEFISTTNNRALAYYPATTNDTVTILKDSNGEYVKFTLNSGVAAPAISNVWTTADGVECVFVNSSDNTYKLYPKVMIGYKIKTSVTLYSNFVYNIYIPEANFNKAMIDGVDATATLVEIDGVNYYHVVVNIPAAESLDDIKLTVTLNSGNTTVDANWTLSVLKYAKSVTNGNYDETTQNLMKDMLVYASASHTYFENALDADKAAEVTALLAGYSKAMPEGEAKKPTDTTYFTTVGVNVGAVPSFRFYLAAGYTKDNFSFKVGNRTVEATEGNDKYGDYLEVTMYAYMMLDDVTFTVKGTDVTGTYNIYSYLDYAKNTVKDANLVAVVEGLMKYSVSAKAYRNAVTGK